MNAHARGLGGGTPRLPGLLLLLLLAAAGCTAHRSETSAREETASSFIDSFMRKVVANDYEGAFQDLDMEAFVNYGRRSAEVYETLPPAMKERFRKDLVEGIYARLFRTFPRERATPLVAAVEGAPDTVEVSGRSPRRNLLFTLKREDGGLKIVQIEKAPLEGDHEPAVAGLLEVCAAGCDFESVQEAIAGAVEGGTVLVHDGTYEGGIDFLGKSVTVRSVNGPRQTFLRGRGTSAKGGGSVVTFASGEGGETVLDGFSISGGEGAAIPGVQSVWTSAGPRGSVTFGGGILCSEASPLLRNLIIRGNTATKGGGLACWKASPLVENCIISGNRAHSDGGALYAGQSEPRFVATTISGNFAGEHGGGLSCYWSNPVVSSSIVWGNSSAGREDSVESCGRAARIDYSDVAVGRRRPGRNDTAWPGPGNIGADPLFRDRRLPGDAPTEEGDYHLTPASPCINRAARRGFPARDIDRDPRPHGRGADMGADEFSPAGAL